MYNGAKIQILDLPGIIQGAKDGKGRGRQVIAVAKTCHLIFIVLDVNKPLVDKRVIENELEGFGIRINKSPPNINFKKKEKGGIAITSTVPLTNITPEVSLIRLAVPKSRHSHRGTGNQSRHERVQDHFRRYRHSLRRDH